MPDWITTVFGVITAVSAALAASLPDSCAKVKVACVCIGAVSHAIGSYFTAAIKPKAGLTNTQQ